MMNEKPILFNGEMIRAILDDGRKTQTRRAIKPQPPRWEWSRQHTERLNLNVSMIDGEYWVKCPYGLPGDRLWVKESWTLLSDAIDLHTVSYAAEAEDGGATVTMHPVKCDRDLKILSSRGKKNPLWMPREFSRITLEVVSVRVERVQEISEEDARAEGVAPMTWISHPENEPAYRVMFQPLWDSINAKRGFPWSANPLVWVVEFKMIPNPVPAHSL